MNGLAGLLAASAAVWAAIVGYLLLLRSRQQRLEGRISKLERRK